MNKLLNQLNPAHTIDVLWDPITTEAFFPEKVHIVTKKFNATAYSELHKPLVKRVMRDTETGIAYALLQEQGDSADTIVVHFNPFANGLNENMLLRAEYCRQVFGALEVRDKTGKFLSIITFPAPGRGARLKLAKKHRLRSAEGQFDSLAAHYLSIVERLGFRRVLIIGFSQGASIATAAAAIAPTVGLQATHLAVGEPANVLIRPKRKLIRNFMAEFKHLPPAIQAGGIQAFETAHRNESAAKYMFGIAAQPRLHYALLRGLSKELFVHDLRQAARNGTLVTIGYGGLTSISPPAVMRKIITDVRKDFSDNLGAIHAIEIQNAQHAWADQLNLLATFYAYALTR